MLILRQSTAIDIRMGPFVDATDGVAPETGITLGAADQAEVLKENGAATSAMAGTFAAVTGADGWYDYTVGTGDVDTVGEVVFVVQDSSVCLPVFVRAFVVEEAVYDAIYDAGSALAMGSVTGAVGSVTGAVGSVTGAVGSVTGAVASVTGAVGSVTGNVGGNVTGSVGSVVGAVGSVTGAVGSVTGHTPQTADHTAGIADIPTVAEFNARTVSATAAGNLEDMYDGTGYTDSTGPSSRAQVDGIGSGSGGSIPFAAIEDNTGGAIIDSVTFVGSVSSGTFASTASFDGTSHVLLDATNVIDIVYGFQVGGGRVGTTVQLHANVDGNADEILVKAYDHVGAGWDTIGTITGAGGTSFVTLEPALFQKYTGTGSELGKVYVRFDTDSTTPSQLEVDQCIVLASNLGQTIGYADGAVWLDTTNGVAGTESFVNGTADNPTDSLADALTIAGNVGVKRIRLISGSSITYTGSQSNCEFFGENWSLALGGQALTDCQITGASLSGTCTGTGIIFERCVVDSAVTLPPCTMRNCYFGDTTITMGSAGNFYFNDCRSRVAGSAAPNIDFAAVGASGLSVRAYSGGLELENMNTGDTASIEGFGAITMNANNSAGDLSYRGVIKFTDNAAGAVNVVPTSPVLDQVQLGVAQSASANTITLATAASSTNGQYDPGRILIVAGTGAGQTRQITDYVGSTRVATISRDWRTNPDTTSSYVVFSDAGSGIHVNEGLAAGGGASTITLNSSGSATDDIYIGQTVFLTGGTGQDQARIVTDYNGTTKVATVHRAWDTQPTSSTSYVMLALPAVGDAIVDTLADTNELQTDWTDGGRLDLLIDSILTDTGTTLPAQITALNDISTADVNAQVLDVLNTDTITLPGQTAPPLAPTHREAISWLYKVLRNRTSQTSSTWSLYADDESTVDAKATVSDDGTTAIKQEIVTGP